MKRPAGLWLPLPGLSNSDVLYDLSGNKNNGTFSQPSVKWVLTPNGTGHGCNSTV